MAKLLFIDDDTDLLLSNERYYAQKGYEVLTASTPAQGLQLIQTEQPDCIVSDIMLSPIDGFELFTEIRKLCSVPVIFVSGRAEEAYKIKGLLLGANDYLVKPYSLAELEARIQVQIRSSNNPDFVMIFSPLELNIITHKAYCKGEEIPLSNRECDLLFLLASAAGRTLGFEEIGQKVWGYYSDDDRHTIMVNTSRLRKKLEAYSGLENCIETVWSEGYRFVAGQGGH